VGFSTEPPARGGRLKKGALKQPAHNQFFETLDATILAASCTSIEYQLCRRFEQFLDIVVGLCRCVNNLQKIESQIWTKLKYLISWKSYFFRYCFSADFDVVAAQITFITSLIKDECFQRI